MLQTVKAVLWSFFGVRNRKSHEAEFKELKPVQVIVTGLVLTFIMIVVLIGFIKLLISFFNVA